jgi:hypothetical protein
LDPDLTPTDKEKKTKEKQIPYAGNHAHKNKL